MADNLPDLQFDDDLPELQFDDAPATATGGLADLQFDDLPELDFGDSQTTVPAAPAPAPEKPGFLSRIGNAFMEDLNKSAQQQAAWLNSDNPNVAGAAGAILSPLAVLGAGDTPIAETEYENRSKARRLGINYTPQGPVDPLVAEKVGGSVGRIMLSGGAAPIVEGAAKLADIAAHEPDQDIASLGTAARVGTAALATYLPMKGGAAIEGAVANSGLGKLGGFLVNAGADALMGYGAQKGQEAVERGATGQGFEDYTLVPSKADIAMSLPGAVAAGLGGLRSARNRRMADTGEPITTPERRAEIENEILAEEAARRNVGLNEPTGDVKLLPAPEVQTTGENPGVAAGLSPFRKERYNGLQQREVQGQASGRPLNTQSQEIAATPTTAGTGVINSRGEQVDMPGAPVAQGEGYNPRLGQFKTSTLEPEAQVAVNRHSYENEAALNAAQRGSVPVQDTIEAGTKLAQNKGAELVRRWKPGVAHNPEQLVAVKAYAGGLHKRIADLETMRDSPDFDQKALADLYSESLNVSKVMAGTKSEAGRALRILRETIGGADYLGKAGDAKSITPTDKQKALELLGTQAYKDKPIPQSVIDQVSNLAPDNVTGLAEILRHQIKVNNKTSLADAVTNTYKAGMLTSLRTHLRNLGGLTANAALRDVDQRLGSVIDWAMSKKTGTRSVTSIGLGKSLVNAGQATKEGFKEAVTVMKGGLPSDEAARDAINRLEFSRDQYTGDTWANKAWDGYVNTVFRSTAAADLPARKFAYKQSMVDQAQVVAKNELSSGAISKADYKSRVEQLLNNPTDEMRLEAGLQAEAAAFSDPNEFATFITTGERSLAGKLEKRGRLGRLGAAGLKAGRATVLPFVKTPLNISWDILKRLTIDPLKVIVDGGMAAAGKNPLNQAEQKAISMAAARAGVGYAAALTGYYLGAKGYDVLTGTSEQESSGMRETNNVAGKQAGSLTLGGTNYRIQDVLSPLSNLAILGNSIAREAYKPLKDENQRTLNVMGAAAKAFTENPFFQGIERADQITKPGGLGRFAQDTVASAVPNVVSDIASLTDSTQRESRKQEGDTTGDVMAKAVMKKIPGLRNQLPPRVNAFGEVQKEDKGNVFDATFSRDARWKSDPVVGELIRLDIGLTKPEKAKGESDEQYLQRVKQNGDNLKSSLARLVTQDRYKNATDDQKRTMIEAVRKALPINRTSSRLGLRR